MRNLTIIAFLMATTSLASAAGNEFFIGQIGDTNNALVGQTNGNNKQGTIQVGKKNSAITSQNDPAGPQTNTSGTRQFGVYNDSLVVQDGGNNTQGTIQGGVEQQGGHHAEGRRPVARPTTPAPLQFGDRTRRPSTQKSGNNMRPRSRAVARTSRSRVSDQRHQLGQEHATTAQIGRDSRPLRRLEGQWQSGNQLGGTGGDNNSGDNSRQQRVRQQWTGCSSARQTRSSSARTAATTPGTLQIASATLTGRTPTRQAWTTTPATSSSAARTLPAFRRTARATGANTTHRRTTRSSASSAGSNSALVGQVSGNNTQGTLQFGAYNKATTGQSATDTGGTNGAFTLQGGIGNKAMTSQTTTGPNGTDLASTGASVATTSLLPSSSVRATSRQPDQDASGITTLDHCPRHRQLSPGVDNNALTVQVGKDNTAYTAQTGGAELCRRPTTRPLQFGVKNNSQLVGQLNGCNVQGRSRPATRTTPRLSVHQRPDRAAHRTLRHHPGRRVQHRCHQPVDRQPAQRWR